MKNGILSLLAAMAMVLGLFIASTIVAYAESVEPSAHENRQIMSTVSASGANAADGNSIQ